ncbi:hypothetical protein [Smaragdicoccus niigatensis]|uniref:hypothetical protein n=1 Tax=Smaragdicoccus niigatensis TaxID=359359 RepID=UPI00036E28DB|nr:hypothetical protein [Smaragdicoccus niigatensis]
MTRRRIRPVLAIAAAVLLIGIAIGYAIWVRPTESRVAPGASISLAPDQLLVVTQRHLATVSAADPNGPRQVSALSCNRVYAAAGTGVCLRQDSAWTYSLHVLDRDLKDTTSFPLPGLPNRARVSTSGRMVSWTTFIAGESYTTSNFSTRTGILDTKSGAQVQSLEAFDITLDGQPYRAIDVNFWGVTFAADDNRFYATMSTNGVRYLVEGDFAAGTVHTIATNVECPSLSPDGKRIAFKQALDGDPAAGWRLSVLDLATLRVTHLAETRSIDDQAAWLDDRTIGYTVRDSSGNPSVWSTPADGSGQPKLLVNDAESPAAL